MQNTTEDKISKINKIILSTKAIISKGKSDTGIRKV